MIKLYKHISVIRRFTLMENYYTIAQAAKLLNVTVQTIRAWDKEGKIETVRTPGNQRRIAKLELSRLTGDRYTEVHDEGPGVKEAVLDYKRKYTVEEYYSWDTSFRCELFEGTIVLLNSPTTKHQGLLGEIFVQLHSFLKGKPCKVFISNFSVHLSTEENTALLPDIVVVCDMSKLTDRNYVGAPDLVVEILSPSTAKMDKKDKFFKYQKYGVREYWIVDPELDILQANILNNSEYITKIYNAEDIVPVSVLKGCEINLAEVFTDW